MSGRNIRPLYRQAMLAALAGLLVNCALGLAKLVAGIAAGSFALLSDAVNSLGDAVASTVVMIALYVAQKPADREHPYGHTRAEAIAATNVALLIVISAVAIAWGAMQRLGQPHQVPPWWALGLAAANVIIKEALYQYKVRVGKRVGSAAVVANAWDHRSDALCSLAVLIGLAAVRFGGPQWQWADAAAAVVVSAAIVWSGVQLFRRAASELMDLQADEPLVDAIRQAALEVPGVCDVETLWVRKSGLEYFVDIHVQVDGRLTVEAGHEIGHAVKDLLQQQFPLLRDVLVHLEPYPPCPDD